VHQRLPERRGHLRGRAGQGEQPDAAVDVVAHAARRRHVPELPQRPVAPDRLQQLLVGEDARRHAHPTGLVRRQLPDDRPDAM
jgi:hypothetical protein